MDTQNMPSGTKIFIPSARRSLLWGVGIGFFFSVLYVVVRWEAGLSKEDWEFTTIVIICIFFSSIAFVYLQFLFGRTGKIEISPKGVTNTTRSGKAYSILWNEVISVSRLSFLMYQESFTIKTSTKHQIHFTEAGLSGSEWKEICKLVKHYTADKQ